MLTLHLSLKKDTGVLKKSTDQWVFCLSSPKFSKNYYATKWRLSWISFCLSTIVAFEHGCSFVAKLSSKNICFFYKIYIICRKKCFYLEKKFYNEKNILLKKTFFTYENINENIKIYVSFQKCIFTQKMFVLQIKYIIKNIFVKASLWPQ